MAEAGELVERILAELDRMRNMARDFVEEVDPQFEDLEGEDEGARAEVRETLGRIAEEWSIDEAVREFSMEDRSSSEIQEASSAETDPALRALTSSGGVEGALSSAQSRVQFWWTKFPGLWAEHRPAR